MYKNILVPTDGSELSLAAADAAIAFAQSCGSRLVALSVAEPYPALPMPDGALVIDPGVDSAEVQARARDRVAQVARAAQAAGVPCTTEVATSLAPHQEITAAARRHGCDVIFMASHARTGLGRLIAGSETEKVLAHADVPVLVFPPPRRRP